MRINELTGYKNIELYKKAKEIFGSDIRDKPIYVSLDEWENIMHQYGFKLLGTGNYGSVYEKPGYPWVFKVFTYDKAYFKYFNYARRNQRNPHLPKIKGNYIRINNNTFVVRLEKLTPISTEQFRKVSGILDQLTDIIQYNIDEYGNELDHSPEEITFIKKHMDLYELMLTLYKTPEFKDLGKDLHQGNIMMRGITPVLVDPVID